MSPRRMERDHLGEAEILNITYFGLQTVRATEAFKISGIHEPIEFVIAYAQLKKACAAANMETGRLDYERGNAIMRACDEIVAGVNASQFVIDIFQAGGGASLNMCINEIIANRALEIMNAPKGSYGVISPYDHVNMSQSDGDAFPSAGRMAMMANHSKLANAISELKNAFLKKSLEFDFILKSSRTSYQDSVPMTLGQEFLSFAEIMKKSAEDLDHASIRLKQLNVGGTEAGTGLNTHKNFPDMAVKKINEITRMEFFKSENLIESSAFSYDFLNYSAQLRNMAACVIKIANDLMLLNSGPNTGFNEINIPPVHAGSSGVPGKTNPAILEMLAMTAMQVSGIDCAVAQASALAPQNLNIYWPLIIYNILFAQKIMTNALNRATTSCVSLITANEAELRAHFEKSAGNTALLLKKAGYAELSLLAREARILKKTVLQLALEKSIISRAELDELQKPRTVTEPADPSGVF